MTSNPLNLNLEELRDRVDPDTFATLERAVANATRELSLLLAQGPCPRPTANGTPCARHKGHEGPCILSEVRGEPTDTWSVTTKDGEELLRVDSPTAEGARDVAMRDPGTRRVSAAEGGLSYRRLGSEEL